MSSLRRQTSQPSQRKSPTSRSNQRIVRWRSLTEFVTENGNYTYGKGVKGKYREQTTSVGDFPPNAFGLYDMHGNVWEWCLDTWHENYNGAPTDGSSWSENDNHFRLLRGGSWDDLPVNCRSSIRNWSARALRSNFCGFRVVCAPSPGFP